MNPHAKKHLGQNFLANRMYAAKMADAAQLKEGDAVLEIGPGTGVLTGELLARGARVTAIEKDADLLPVLREKFRDALATKQLALIEGDALQAKRPRGPYKLVANIPYYITGEILRSFLDTAPRPLSLTLLVQKEVAERAIARAGKESLLSIGIKAYGTPKLVARVPAGNFRPKPKVDSAILSIGDVSDAFLKEVGAQQFFSVVRAGFAHKRKKLLGNLGEAGFDRHRAQKALVNMGFSENTRAEELPPDAWRALARAVR